MVFYRGIAHVNTVDTEVSVLKVTSTEAEKKKIIAVRLTNETNAGMLKFYVDRENFFEGNTSHRTAQATIEDFLEFAIDRVLEIGETFEVTLQNVGAGVNAEIYGDIVYDIV